MSSRRRVHEARRRAATEGRLPTAVPDMVVRCDMCTDGHPAGQFIERFRYSRSVNRWLATAMTPEVHLRPDGTPTNDLVGWEGPMPVRSNWKLRCPSCGDPVPARDAKLQAAFELYRQAAASDERVPTVSMTLTLRMLKRMLSHLRGLPEPLGPRSAPR